VKRVRTVSAAAVLVLLASTAAFAQSRPLKTEDPETIAAGQIALQAGVDFEHTTFYPASGLKGNLTRWGTFTLDFGVSSIAQIELSGGIHNSLNITSRSEAPLSSMLTVSGDRTGDIEDGVIGAKIRFASETARRPSMGIRFATKLPNASNESGLGLDTTDFQFSALFGKTVRSLRVVGNFGFGILPDPTRGDSQNDVILYGVSVARAVRQGLEIVAEVNGRASTRSGTPPVGTESRSAVRFGGRYTHGAIRYDTALMFGLLTPDPTWGLTFGVTWVFHAFKVP